MKNDLPQTNLLFKNDTYQDYLKRIEGFEKNRSLCRHNLEHFLDVARIASIMVCEASLKVSRDLIYTTALLHDIGRFVEYEDGTPHEKASYHLAEQFLEHLNFTPDDKKVILDAILNHRNASATSFNAIFYNADKKSRLCYRCHAKEECNWNTEKQNLTINY